jgi:hypothetical protein
VTERPAPPHLRMERLYWERRPGPSAHRALSIAMTTRISRRRFLSTAALSLAAARLRAQNQPGTQITLAIPDEAAGAHMPADFVGLSYEVQQLVDPSFFSGANTGLITQFKALSPNGVLRLGGNTSEFAYWRATPESPEPEHPKTREVVGEPKPEYYAVTGEAP